MVDYGAFHEVVYPKAAGMELDLLGQTKPTSSGAETASFWRPSKEKKYSSVNTFSFSLQAKYKVQNVKSNQIQNKYLIVNLEGFPNV